MSPESAILPKSVPWVIKPLVPEPVYTDREEHLEYLYHAATEAARRRTMSTVLLGQRRMGKTEVFKRVVNRLFFEQDPEDPNAVVPVYYSFPDQPMDVTAFAVDYLENLIRYYVGFYTRQPWIVEKRITGDALIRTVHEAKECFPFTGRLDWMLDWHDAICRKDTPFPQRDALDAVRRVADSDDSTIVVFLDEFQNIRLPRHNFELTGFMQEAVESPNCPHFVTGSEINDSVQEKFSWHACGKFKIRTLDAMTGYWGAELAKKVAAYYDAELSEKMAPVVADRCGGNPFYITTMIRQAAFRQIPIENNEVLDRILKLDLFLSFYMDERYS